MSSKRLLAMARVANKTRCHVPLINSKDQPIPQQFKPGAKLWEGEGRTVAGLRALDPKIIRGSTGVYGFNTGKYGPIAFASNKHNEKQALVARVLADTHTPNAELDACITWCKTNFRKLFPKMRQIKSVDFETYLSRSNASPGVKQTLRRTKSQLDSEGFDENSFIPRSLSKLWTTRSSFVKVENLLYQTILGKKDKAPRLIQGARPEFIVLVGPWIMAVQDLFKRRWNTKNNLCFTSGISSEKLASYITSGHGPIVEDDLGKFDCSIREPWCRLETWMCQKMGAPRAVLMLMHANIKTHGYTLHGWKYKCDGTRKSGDPYTSLMNSIINGLSHLYIYCTHLNLSVDQARSTLWMLVQGDDNLMRHLQNVEIPWQPRMEALGFDSEAVYRCSLTEAEFCSNRLYPTDIGWLFGPKPGKVLAKLGYIVTPPDGVHYKSLMRGVALGLRKICNFIPPIKCVIDRVLQLTEGFKASYVRNWDEHVIKVGGDRLANSTIDTQVALSDTYHWTCEMQSKFEELVSNLELGDSYDDAYADLLFDRDTSGPQRIFNNL